MRIRWIGFPVGEFQDNHDEIGFGGHGYATISLEGTPLQLGGSFGYMSQGSFKVETEAIVGALSFPAEVVTRNNVFLGHLLLRLQNTEPSVRPYVDGYFGFGRFWTTTEVTVFEETEIINESDIDTWTASYGVGGGLMIEVHRSNMIAGDGETVEGEASICIDLGVRYLIGGKADYAKTDVVDQSGSFETTASRTDMVTAHIGIAVQFF